MILVNAIINVVEDVEIRIHLRNQMTASGLERVLVGMKELSDEHVDRQIREFKSLAENDQDELMEVYDDHVLNDKDDPREVFEYLLSNVEGTRAYDFFLSCLQHLLLINNEETQIRSRYFQIIDNLVAQVVLDHKGLADDFSADYHTTVQHLIDKFADQDQLKTTLEDLKELQVNYAELERERDALRAQLSQEKGNLMLKIMFVISTLFFSGQRCFRNGSIKRESCFLGRPAANVSSYYFHTSKKTNRLTK